MGDGASRARFRPSSTLERPGSAGRGPVGRCARPVPCARVERFDVIVAGVGGMGSAALFHLARRGLRVLGIDPHGIAHDRGSSHGQTRIIRKAYFEHPAYVPLVERAYAGWSELESLSGEQLFQPTGLLTVGRPDGPVVQGTRRSANEHGLSIESLDGDELRHRFGLLRGDADMIGLWEPEAGFLHVEACVRTFIDQAVRYGATLALGESVDRWETSAGGVAVTAGRGRYQADRLVVCAGPWTARLVPGLGIPIAVRRKVMMWFDAPDDRYRLDHGFPVFCFDTAEGFYYGYPALADGLLKVARHTGGQPVDHPSRIDRSLQLEDRMEVVEFMRRHLPGVGRDVRDYSVCMYSMTPDEHFIVDRLPSAPHVIVAAGFSGHGFKFAPVIGSALADLVEHGRTLEPIGLFSADRSRCP